MELINLGPSNVEAVHVQALSTAAHAQRAKSHKICKGVLSICFICNSCNFLYEVDYNQCCVQYYHQL